MGTGQKRNKLVVPQANRQCTSLSMKWQMKLVFLTRFRVATGDKSLQETVALSAVIWLKG